MRRLRFPSQAPPRPASLRREEGFALLITITLVAFLVLILVALACLTRVETQVASNSQQLAQARQNALFALNIALGQLQKHAGPDQRVTASADLAGAADGSQLADGAVPVNTQSINTTPNGLTAVRAGTRHWTGVWGNADLPGDIFTRTPGPVLLNWLVSGNEAATFTQDSPLTGQITASNGDGGTVAPVFSPAQVTAGLSAVPGAAALADATLAGDPARILVGPGTVGTAAGASENYVVAPLVPLTAPAGAVPGLAPGDTPTTGRYAWWVGDEGVKARINLVDRYAEATATAGVATSHAEARARLATAPRSGVEVIEDFAASNYAARTQSSTSADNIAVNVLSLSQAGLLDQAQLTPARLGPRTHAFTTHSLGLVTDSLNGGLRRDLSYYLEQAVLPAWTGTNGTPAGTGNPIIPETVNGTALSPKGTAATYGALAAPRWDWLHSFYNAPVAGATATDTGTINVQPATTAQTGVSPVVTLFRLQIGARRNIGGGTDQLHSLATPRIILANPYTTRLAAPNGLSLEILFDGSAYDSTTNPSEPPPGGTTNYVWPYLQLLVQNTGTPSVIRYQMPLFSTRAHNATLLSSIKFAIPAGTTWAPGEAKLFSLAGNVTVGTYGTPRTVTLMEGRPVPDVFNAVISPPFDVPPLVAPATYVRDEYAYKEQGQNIPLMLELRDLSSDALVQSVSGINMQVVGDYFFRPGLENTPDDPARVFTARPVRVLEAALYSPGDTFASSANGELNSTQRPYLDYNVRAAQFRSTNSSYTAAPYYRRLRGDTQQELLNNPDGYSMLIFANDINPANPQPWGRTSQQNVGQTMTTMLYDVPRRLSPGEMPLTSLAQFQHANLTADDIALSVGHQPAYAAGNSYATPFVARDSTVQARDDVYATWHPPSETNFQRTRSRRYFDLAYLLNASLWDGYFFSTIPPAAVQPVPTAASLEPMNPRFRLTVTAQEDATAGNVLDGEKAAAHVVIDGAFNINSTSVDAWAAVLGGMKNLPSLPHAATATTDAVFPRSLRQTGAGQSSPVGDSAAAYQGIRQLTDAQVRALAEAIVKQVRLRGPFVSLSHFINRALVPATTTADPDGLGFHGALQAALDHPDVAINTLSFPVSAGGAAAADRVMIPTTAQVDVTATHDDRFARGTWSLYADGVNFTAGLPTIPPVPPATAPTSTHASRSAGIPGWLTQADVLQVIGPVLAARSDTFLIRTYGEVINPVTNTITGRAWCEAVVQRQADYVQPGTAPTGNLPEESGAALTTENQRFGRQFKVVSFRWLNANDI